MSVRRLITGVATAGLLLVAAAGSALAAPTSTIEQVKVSNGQMSIVVALSDVPAGADIDTRKRAVERLEASEDRLRRMVNVDVVGILIFDQSATLIDCNDAFLKMFGVSQQAMMYRFINLGFVRNI